MIRVTIESIIDGETKSIVIETAAFLFAAVENDVLTDTPGDIRSGFVNDPTMCEDIGPKHVIGLTAGTLSQVYEIEEDPENAAKLINMAELVAEAANLTGASRPHGRLK